MSLENNIKDIISKKLEDGTVEKLIEEQLEKGMNKALESLFGSYGDVTKVIEEKVKSVMIPYLENHDYSRYIVKLDSVLTEVIEKTTADNRKLLSNFKELMTIDTSIKVIKVSELFGKWCKYVEENVETDGLEVDYDDGPSYESVSVTYEFEETEKKDWSKYEKGRIVFECEHDNEMNFCIDLYRWDDIHKTNQWDFDAKTECSLSSLRHIDEFTLYIMSLKQANVKIEIDETDDSEGITPEKEPEASFS